MDYLTSEYMLWDLSYDLFKCLIQIVKGEKNPYNPLSMLNSLTAGVLSWKLVAGKHADFLGSFKPHNSG